MSYGYAEVTGEPALRRLSFYEAAQYSFFIAVLTQPNRIGGMAVRIQIVADISSDAPDG